MSFGFEVFSAGGVKTLSDADLAIQFIDRFVVSPTTSGSRTYTNVGFSNIVVTSTAVEPTTTSAASFTAINYINTSASIVGNTITVSWSPNFQSGLLRDVEVFVFGY
jgi:hypothetical protein